MPPLAQPYQRRRWESNPLKAALQAAAVPSGSSATLSSVLARSRTWPSTFAGSRASPPHSEDLLFSALPRNRTSSGSFEDCCATPVHLQGKRLDQESNPGTDRRLVVDLRRVLCDPLHHRDPKRPDLESNQGQGLRSALCNPLHYRDMFLSFQSRRLDLHQHDAVYKTAASLFGHVGLSQAGARGFEPRRAALEAASSPRRTLLNRPRPCGRGRWA